MKAVITVGISASGKTTRAKELVEEGYVDVNRDWIRQNIVVPGSTWATYRFTKSRENEVTRIQEQMVMDAYGKGQNVVISDTNLGAGSVSKWTNLLEDLGYVVTVEEIEVDFEEAYKRDNLRPNGVGFRVLYTQWLSWLKFRKRKTYTQNGRLPNCIIFDIDGTIATMDGRGPFDWSRVGEDKPRWFILEMLEGYRQSGYTIILVSGRDGSCRPETEEWLNYHCVYYHDLYMRGEGDYRKDTVVKEEIFWNYIAPKYNVQAVVDDRPCVLRMWLELKIPNVISVGNPYIEF